MPILAIPRRAELRRAGKRLQHRIAVIREACPPCAWSCPDRADVVRRSDEEDLQAQIAAWMRLQPQMSEAAQNKLREAAELWFRKGSSRKERR
jgi:hypothetical protein